MNEIITSCSYYKINDQVYFGRKIDVDQNRKMKFSCDDGDDHEEQSKKAKQRKVRKNSLRGTDIWHYFKGDGYLKIVYIVDKEGKTILNRIDDTSLTLNAADSIYILYKSLDLRVSKSDIAYDCLSLSYNVDMND